MDGVIGLAEMKEETTEIFMLSARPWPSPGTSVNRKLGRCGGVNSIVKSSHFRMVAFSFLSFYLLCRRHSLSSFLMYYVFSWDMHRLMDSLLDLVLAPGLDFYNGLCT